MSFASQLAPPTTCSGGCSTGAVTACDCDSTSSDVAFNVFFGVYTIVNPGPAPVPLHWPLPLPADPNFVVTPTTITPREAGRYLVTYTAPVAVSGSVRVLSALITLNGSPNIAVAFSISDGEVATYRDQVLLDLTPSTHIGLALQCQGVTGQVGVGSSSFSFARIGNTV